MYGLLMVKILSINFPYALTEKISILSFRIGRCKGFHCTVACLWVTNVLEGRNDKVTIPSFVTGIALADSNGVQVALLDFTPCCLWHHM